MQIRNLGWRPGNLPFMGHIRLDLADIEFVHNDEIALDDDDVILLEEPARAGARRAISARLPQPRRRPGHAPSFDDAATVVWAVPERARAGASW